MFTLPFIACAINKQIVLFRPASPINDMSGFEGLYYYSLNGSQSISASNGRGGEILWHMQSLRLPRRCEAPRRHTPRRAKHQRHRRAVARRRGTPSRLARR